MEWIRGWVRDAFLCLFPSVDLSGRVPYRVAKGFYEPMNPVQQEGTIQIEYDAVYALVNNRLTRVPTAIAATPPICLGCDFYHGRVYNGDRFVCSIHPVGNGENCVDFEPRALKDV